MSTDNFDVKLLAEKLSKLNNSQQSIESLSRWCVSHRKKARQVVETWEKTFNSSEKDQCVSFLFLANDILQNSRRKGSEFVNEFWKVLPNALKHVHKNGDEHGRKTVSRLVDIWEERKVFGSRAQNLKEDLFGKEAPSQATSQATSQAPSQALSQSVSNGKSVNPVKIVKKDAQAIRIKLPVGDVVEKIVTAFYNLHEECSNEEAALAKCHVAVLSSESLEKDVEAATSQGVQPGPAMFSQLQDHESILLQCVEQLEGAEATRQALVSQLNEALQDQGKKLEILHSQLQIARSRINASGNLRQVLSSGNNIISPLTTSMDTSTELENPQKPTTSFAPLGATTNEENNKKATAAAVAAKLAASTSSSQMFVSVLSSLVAEEAAKAEKRQKLDTPTTDSSLGANNPFYSNLQQSLTSLPFAPTNNQPVSSLPPPPPPPLPQANQFMPSGGMMMPFAFVSGSLPPPPIPSSVPMNLGRPPAQQSQQPPVSSGGGGYYRPPPSMGIYGQNQQATTPSPVHRQ